MEFKPITEALCDNGVLARDVIYCEGDLKNGECIVKCEACVCCNNFLTCRFSNFKFAGAGA